MKLFIRVATPIFFAVILSIAVPVFAQSENENLIEERIIESVNKPKEDDYVSPTVENLSKLYWAIGKLDINDMKMIDYYLMINECPIYLQYYHNDFEWGKIREATKNYILNNMDKFPTRFEIITPIGIDRYDIEKEEFEVRSNSKILGLRRLDFAMNPQGYKETCTKKGDIFEYPDNIVIVLNRPMVLEKFPVKRELAKLYIEDAKSFYESLPPEYQMKTYERMAYLRLKVRITQYKNTQRVLGGSLRAVVFGRLEGYEIYADSEKLKPLYYRDIQERRFRRIKKEAGVNPSEEGKDESEEDELGESEYSEE